MSLVLLTDDQVIDLIKNNTIKSCSLDALPAAVMRKCYLTLVPALKNIINLSLTTGEMPRDLKTAMVKPLLKKSNSDPGEFVNFRPVSNLKFVSKLTEKAVLHTYTYIHKLYLSSDFSVAYIASISDPNLLILKVTT